MEISRDVIERHNRSPSRIQYSLRMSIRHRLNFLRTTLPHSIACILRALNCPIRLGNFLDSVTRSHEVSALSCYRITRIFFFFTILELESMDRSIHGDFVPRFFNPIWALDLESYMEGYMHGCSEIIYILSLSTTFFYLIYSNYIYKILSYLEALREANFNYKDIKNSNNIYFNDVWNILTLLKYYLKYFKNFK